MADTGYHIHHKIYPHILQFVHMYITQEDWKLQDASLLALGCVACKNTTLNLSSEIQTLLPHIYQLLSHSQLPLRVTAAWTLGRICKYYKRSSLTTLSLCSDAMQQSLSDSPPVATVMCWVSSFPLPFIF